MAHFVKLTLKNDDPPTIQKFYNLDRFDYIDTDEQGSWLNRDDSAEGPFLESAEQILGMRA